MRLQRVRISTEHRIGVGRHTDVGAGMTRETTLPRTCSPRTRAFREALQHGPWVQMQRVAGDEESRAANRQRRRAFLGECPEGNEPLVLLAPRHARLGGRSSSPRAAHNVVQGIHLPARPPGSPGTRRLCAQSQNSCSGSSTVPLLVCEGAMPKKGTHGRTDARVSSSTGTDGVADLQPLLQMCKKWHVHISSSTAQIWAGWGPPDSEALVERRAEGYVRARARARVVDDSDLQRGLSYRYC
ncbi:hypothetical protein F4823DRAFT_562112 [Ustulina deusta]|nr:hypothetical protein F4823DRAFT_562112 [Ustulina deusta]